MKQAKGVLVKPEVQKLPGLAPGTSWTLSARVQLTARAKPKSTLSLTGTAPGATTATGSLLVKLKHAPPSPQEKKEGSGVNPLPSWHSATGRRRIRTRGNTLFRRVLYQLSYPAAAP